MRAHHLAASLLLTACVAAAQAAATTTFVPAGDQVVVERLPASSLSSAAQRERRLALRARADHLPSAIEAATDALQRARRSGDPRDLGEAQAALSPWWSLAAPPAAVRLLRASILQSLHRFDDARADLDALLRPESAADTSLRRQARLVRAAVHQVQGRLSDARDDCDALGAELRATGPRSSAHARAAQACVAELRSLQGDPDTATRLLAALHVVQPDDAWIALLRAELAQRSDRPLEAARLLEPFTSAPGAEIYAVAAHADALLHAGRADAALALIDRRAVTQAAALLPEALQLRRAVALKRLEHHDASSQTRMLRDALDVARQRGDAPHLREEAWLALDVEADAARAWRLAQANWQTQKEPIDALLYVRAAVAAEQRAQAQNFVEQRRAEGWHDLRLARALEAAR